MLSMQCVVYIVVAAQCPGLSWSLLVLLFLYSICLDVIMGFNVSTLYSIPLKEGRFRPPSYSQSGVHQFFGDQGKDQNREKAVRKRTRQSQFGNWTGCQMAHQVARYCARNRR